MPRCPVCDTPVDLTRVATPPFCSERCRGIDLGRWLDEGYSLPAKPRDEEEEGEEGLAPEPLDE